MSKRFIISLSAACLIAGPILAQARTTTVAGLKTTGACNDEYKANKGALKDAKERKKDFIAACRALAPGTPTPIGNVAAQPTSPTSPQPAPAGQATAPVSPARRSAAPIRQAAATPPGESACANGYARLHQPHGRSVL